MSKHIKMQGAKAVIEQDESGQYQGQEAITSADQKESKPFMMTDKARYYVRLDPVRGGEVIRHQKG